MALVAITLLLVLIAVVAIGRNQARFGSRGAATAELVIDGSGARRVLADGRTESVGWTELTRVEVVHAQKGPHAASGGVVMLAGDDTHGCLVPLDRLGDTRLLDHLERLPGFDVDAFVRALQDPEGGEIVCWTAPA